MFQALPLPQLRREQGWLLYLANTGPFTMHSSMGTITHERVVELRRAREMGQTGEIPDYNFLSSLLPQNTRICFGRYEVSLFCPCFNSTNNKTVASTPGVWSWRIWSMASTGGLGDKNALTTKLEVITGPFQLSYHHHTSSTYQGPRHQSYDDGAWIRTNNGLALFL